MTLPVPILENVSVLNTRRILGGTFHLAPNPVVNQIIEFALAYNANKHGIRLYAFCALSDHLHAPHHDPDGNSVEFRRDFHSQVTRSLNAYRGTTEAKWSPNRNGPVVLYDEESILDKIAYTIANPCHHDLVDKPEHWPGAISLVKDLAARPRTIKKPACFYDPEGDVPKSVTLQFVKPPELEHMTLKQYRDEIARRVDAKCKAARKERKGRVVGRRAVLAQDPTDSAKSEKKSGKLNPRFACKNSALRMALLAWLTWFRGVHRNARIAFEKGDYDREFPLGTYLHVRRFDVNCSNTGPPTASDVE